MPEELQLKILKNCNEKIEFNINSDSKKSISKPLYSNEQLVQMMNGDLIKVVEMENLFKAQAKNLIVKLEAYIVEEKLDLISEEVHKFKASANLFQLQELKEPIRTLEKLEANAENKEDIIRLSKLIINYLKLL